MDEQVVKWFLSNAFESDTRAGIYLRTLDYQKDWFIRDTDSIRQVLDEIQSLEVEADRVIGISQESIERYKKRKAAFFSGNIINLEKKDYSGLVQTDSSSQILHQRDNSDLKELLAIIPNEVETQSSSKIEEVCRYSYVKRYLVKECARFNSFILRIKRELEEARLTDLKVYA